MCPWLYSSPRVANHGRNLKIVCLSLVVIYYGRNGSIGDFSQGCESLSSFSFDARSSYRRISTVFSSRSLAVGLRDS